MFCINCGRELETNSNFCTACGLPQNATASTPSKPLPFTLKHFSGVVGILNVAVAFAAIVLMAAQSNTDTGFHLGNFVLGLELSLAVLCLIGCGVAGLVFLTKSFGPAHPKQTRDRELAKLLLLGPLLWICVIILIYVIINVARQLFTR